MTMLLRLCLSFVLVALACTGVRADAPPDPALVGRAAAVIADVRARADGGERVLQADDLIRFQEQILTGAAGKTTIVFRDGSTLELGPNAAVTIDRFVFDPQAGISDKQVSIARGMFRFVSGAGTPVAKASIRTPVGTAGIRGSVLIGFVVPDMPLILIGGHGAFVFENAGGTTSFNGGQAIGVGGSNQPPITGDRIPAALVAAVVQSVQQTLGTTPDTPGAPGAATQQALARSNSLTAAQQRQGQTGQGQQGGAQPTTVVRVDVPPQLAAAFRVGLLGGNPVLTPEQQAVLRQLEAQNPQAGRALSTFFAAQTNLHTQTQQRATTEVQAGLTQVLTPQQLARQQAQARAPAPPALVPVPPALRAAMAAGNAEVVARAIETLSGGDPARRAALTQAMVAEAERLLATNPQLAVQLARIAVQLVRELPVQTSAPPQVLQTVTIAARIMIHPDAQRVAPQELANLTVQAAQVLSNPTIYGANPQTAIQAMAHVYQAAGSTDVRNTGLGSATEVARILAGAAQSGPLNTANEANFAQIMEILGRTLSFEVRRDREPGASDPSNPSETPMKYENPLFQASPT